MNSAEAPRRVVVTADDVIQDGVLLHIGTDEALRSIMARYYPDVPFDLGGEALAILDEPAG